MPQAAPSSVAVNVVPFGQLRFIEMRVPALVCTMTTGEAKELAYRLLEAAAVARGDSKTPGLIEP